MLRQGKSRSERTLRNSWPTAPVTPTTATETVRSRDRALLRRARTRRAEAIRLQVQLQHHHRCPIEGTLRVGSIKAMKKRKKKRFLSTNCQICYAQSRLKLPHCLPSTDSRIYLDSCFLRYADHNVSADATDAYDTAVCGNASTNSSAFKDAATRLVANLTAAALNQTEFYQVGSANVAADGLVYGMAQCWKSLNASGCRDCLQSARASAVKCLPATDGKALNAGCFVRYSTDPFYLAASSNGGGSSAIC